MKFTALDVRNLKENIKWWLLFSNFLSITAIGSVSAKIWHFLVLLIKQDNNSLFMLSLDHLLFPREFNHHFPQNIILTIYFTLQVWVISNCVCLEPQIHATMISNIALNFFMSLYPIIASTRRIHKQSNASRGKMYWKMA